MLYASEIYVVSVISVLMYLQERDADMKNEILEVH